MLGNLLIIDYTVKFIDTLKLTSKIRQEWLHDINRVRVFKGMILLFELIEIDGRLITNAY